MKKNKKIYIVLVILLAVAVCILVFCGRKGNKGKTKVFSDEMLEVHFIDVGQGDCTLIEVDNEYMLIDTGIPDSQSDLEEYLVSYGIEKFEYVIATHPHQDHIGNMDYIIEEYEIETFMMPDVTYNTMCYQSMMEALEIGRVNVVNPKQGAVYELGGAQFTIISDSEADYGDNINNYSIGIKLTYGETNFVLCGDAEYEAEQDIINSGMDIGADVLKINHHGSGSSSSEAFLEEIDADYAIICVGADNEYGHPREKILNRLQSFDMTVYRTDKEGNIIIRSDGEKLLFYLEKNESLALLN